MTYTAAQEIQEDIHPAVPYLSSSSPTTYVIWGLFLKHRVNILCVLIILREPQQLNGLLLLPPDKMHTHCHVCYMSVILPSLLIFCMWKSKLVNLPMYLCHSFVHNNIYIFLSLFSCLCVCGSIVFTFCCCSLWKQVCYS